MAKKKRAARNRQKSRDHWEPLGSVTIDTASLLLIDPCHAGCDIAGVAGEEEIAIDKHCTAVVTSTGLGDGRYLVEGRYHASTVLGRRLAEIRVRFLDDEGNYLSVEEEA